MALSVKRRDQDLTQQLLSSRERSDVAIHGRLRSTPSLDCFAPLAMTGLGTAAVCVTRRQQAARCIPAHANSLGRSEFLSIRLVARALCMRARGPVTRHTGAALESAQSSSIAPPRIPTRRTRNGTIKERIPRRAPPPTSVVAVKLTPRACPPCVLRTSERRRSLKTSDFPGAGPSAVNYQSSPPRTASHDARDKSMVLAMATGRLSSSACPFLRSAAASPSSLASTPEPPSVAPSR